MEYNWVLAEVTNARIVGAEVTSNDPCAYDGGTSANLLT